jgi:hypothetical protein
MAKLRIGFSSDFTLDSSEVGIGTTNPTAKLQVVDTIKGDFNIAGVSTLTSYSGFAAQKQNVTKESTTGISTVGVGTFVQSYETETGNLELVGQFNTVSEDIIVDEGKIFEITTTNITGITTLGTQEVYAPDPSVVSVGTLESVSIQSHFSVPDGGISERVDNPIEGSVRFNDDLNTLEFYNGVEWRQFTVTGASGRGVFGGGAAGKERMGGASSSTRAVFAGGRTPTQLSEIDYVEISTIGNALNFGDLRATYRNQGSCSSPVRGFFAGGSYDPVGNLSQIEYITIASTGNSIEFGDLTQIRSSFGGCSNSTRGVFGGGLYFVSPTNYSSKVIDYISLQSLGNAISFGELIESTDSISSCSNSVRGIFGGGYRRTPASGGDINVIQYITITSEGNAIDFGDLSIGGASPAGVQTLTVV